MTLDFGDPLVVAALSEDIEKNSSEAAEQGVDAVELRIDLYDGAVPDLRSHTPSLPVIVTNRPVEQGGEYRGDEDDRIEKLTGVLQHPSVEAVDIELTADTDNHGRVLDAAAENDVSVIVSYHDFNGTPPSAELLDVLGRAGEIGDIAKLAVMPSTYRDVVRVLEATLDYDGTACTIAMGEVGMHSRVVAPLYGSVLTYGSLGTGTAPGQLSVEDLVTILDLFGVR